jgi:hypothetical protein
MVLQIFPEPTSSSLNADSYTVPAALRRYKVVKNFDAAVYTITTSPNTSQATIQFDTGSSFVQTSTVSGTVTYNLASAAVGVYIYIDAGTNTVVTIDKVAAALSGAEVSGTLDTITATNTYNQTGILYVLAVGGGGGGGGSYSGNNWNYGGWGGGYGYQVGGIVYANTATSVTIGAKGNGAAAYASAGNAGGTTSFGNLISAAGGQPGDYGQGGGGTGGRGGSSGSNGQAGPFTTSVEHPTVTTDTNGGGGGGWSQTNNNTVNVGQTGAGSGVGTGGTGGGYSGTAMVRGGDATGYGAGGGGGGSKGSFAAPYSGIGGGDGSPGVVYVLRGF